MNKLQQDLNLKTFAAMVKGEFGIEAIMEHKFHPTRRWRFDFAIIEQKIAIEVEGGVWTNGRHTRGKGFIGDMEKYNTATAMGWRVLRVTHKDLCTLNTLNLIKMAICNPFCQ
ncbi:MAG: hypothetical protein ACRCZB_07615 [Bacteroidales bacterium]